MTREFDSVVAEDDEKPGKNMHTPHEQKSSEEMGIVGGTQWHVDEGINER